MQDVERVDGGFGAGPGAPEGRIDGGVDALVERLLAGLLRLPYIDVLQRPVGLLDTKVGERAGDRFRAELFDDPPVEVLSDRYVLDVGIDQGPTSCTMIRNSFG